MKKLAIAGLLAAALSLSALSQQRAAADCCFHCGIGLSLDINCSCTCCCNPCCNPCCGYCPQVCAQPDCGYGGYGDSGCYGGYAAAPYAAPQAAPIAAPAAVQTGVQNAGYYPAAYGYPATGYGYGNGYGYNQAPSYWYGR